MAAFLWKRHGLLTNAFIYSLRDVIQLRVYSNGLKRSPIRVLSISEANELAKRPQKLKNRTPLSATSPLPQNIENIKISTADNRKNKISSGTDYPKIHRLNKENKSLIDKFENGEERKRYLVSKRDLPVTDSKQISELSDKIQFKQTRNKKVEKSEFLGNVQYEKLAIGDYRFGPVVNEAKLPKYEITKKSTILLEGKRLVSEGVAAALKIKSLFFTDVELLVDMPLQHLTETGTKLYKVSPKHMKIWSDTVAPSGLMAICSLPAVTNSKTESRLPITVICDHVEDPGYFGTMLRAAAAAGCSRIFVTRGCIDPWTPKVLRAGMGAHFHIPIINAEWEFILSYLSSHSDVFLVSNKTPNNDSPVPKIPRAVLQKAMTAGDETDQPAINRKQVKMFEALRFPSRSYEMVNYSDGKEVVLVAGDKDIPSPEAKLFAYRRGADMIYVPGAYEINHAVISSVVLFEIQRQLHKKLTDDANNI